MPTVAARRARIASARSEFLRFGSAATESVPDVVAASWQRSFSAGVDASSSQARFHDDLDVSGRLVRCSDPVIARLGDEVTQMPLSIVLTDHRARVLSRSETDHTIGALLDKVSLAPGFNYAEASVGTNGIGTVFESGQPLYIVGPEHFHEQLQPFACAGSPIRDPLTGRVEGVLDITCLSEDSSPLMQSLVRSAAHEIEHNLLVDRSQCQQALFETFVKLDARSRGAVMAIGGSVVMGNAIAQNRFDPAEQWLIHEHARYLMLSPGDPVDRVELPGGKTVQIRGTRITVGNDIAGIVVAVEIVAESTMPARSTLQVDLSVDVLSPFAAPPEATPDSEEPSIPAAGTGSVLWNRASSDITSALARSRVLLVRGEDGCGKTALILDIHRRTLGDATVHMVTPDRESLAELGRFERVRGDRRALVVLTHLDRLDEEGMHTVCAFLGTNNRAPGLTIVATVPVTQLPATPAFTELMAWFDDSVTVAPLRHRVDDIPPLVTSLLASMTGRRYAAVSPAAMRLIRRFSWPRNIPQLEEALEFALVRRPVGEIQAEDLPGYCHSESMRQLTAIEASERDLIVHALHEADGNRLQAAAALGIARSSLYRKLKSFGIIAA
ncbi:GAF domain-containing protein [Subtercola sp. PAMC28395]|uniref:sigma-54-dependent Fis family transcriptional regulator n=1 Tax=Subtercola sp. PAMC28395 TaxID=2846775 RepID=UPI001C0B7B4F|nr:helix-turn-helix domain-containing protein [Subtercola sp. PAMC28395]QWT24473.1 GAF domain-containing protein [Subtercola sp. PAMC28395]